ncbi:MULTISPECIES: ankyrin repeat domain-containing protein [unclassified Streptomyces]|uniref:ankyrin repeat domain-containing protein n=1 Tax=unclassified Streptomyces TaxID=2593676 RepID=UPI0036641B86
MTVAAPLPGALRPEDAAAWLRIRRHAVPRRMIERATAHRLAGDWGSACAAARVDITFELPRIASRYGAAVAGAVERDLRHLAPDLLRWHLPRVLGGRTTLAPGRRIVLAHYDPDGAAARGRGVPALHVTTHAMVDGPQRLRLSCAPLPWHGVTDHHPAWSTEDWTAAGRLWDVRHTAELRSHAGPADRLPFFRPDGTPLAPEELPAADPGAADPAGRAEWSAVLQARGETEEALAVAGIALDPTRPEAPYLAQSVRTALAALRGAVVDPSRIADEARRYAAAGAGDRFHFVPHRRCPVGLEPADPGSGAILSARVGLARGEQLHGLTRLPDHAWQPLPDLQLVRAGRLDPRALHPLVGAALFPGAGPAAGPPDPAAPRPVRVRCAGVWHEVRSRGGVLDIPHDEQDQQRERALRESGGTAVGCFAAREAWTSGKGRLPRALRAERDELLQRLQHGDAPAVLALLDAGVDPWARDAKGRGLLHLLPLLDHEELLPRLLDAGLDLEAEDAAGSTPLGSAVHDGGSAALVRALIAAGGRIDVLDGEGLSLPQVARCYGRTDLAFLRPLVEREFPGLGCPRFDGIRDIREWYTDREDQLAYAEDRGEEDLFPDTGDECFPPDLAAGLPDLRGPGPREAGATHPPGNVPEEIHWDDRDAPDDTEEDAGHDDAEGAV